MLRRRCYQDGLPSICKLQATWLRQETTRRTLIIRHPISTVRSPQVPEDPANWLAWRWSHTLAFTAP
jgi:hypothetical protein